MSIGPIGTWDVGAHAKQDDQIADVTRHVNDYVDNGRPTTRHTHSLTTCRVRPGV